MQLALFFPFSTPEKAENAPLSDEPSIAFFDPSPIQELVKDILKRDLAAADRQPAYVDRVTILSGTISLEEYLRIVEDPRTEDLKLEIYKGILKAKMVRDHIPTQEELQFYLEITCYAIELIDSSKKLRWYICQFNFLSFFDLIWFFFDFFFVLFSLFFLKILLVTFFYCIF